MKFLILFISFFVSFYTMGQSLDELSKEKEKTAKEIIYTNKLLRDAGKNAEASLSHLILIRRQLKLQKKLIEEINSEIKLINISIADNTLIVSLINSDLEIIKENYASMIRYAGRNSSIDNKLLFILSSEDFNQAYKRFIYLKQYSDYRRKQIVLISSLKGLLYKKNEDLESRKKEKRYLLVAKRKETEELLNQKSSQNTYYAELQSQQRKLKAKLNKQLKIERKLQQEIEKVIALEKNKGKKTDYELTPEELMLSDDFSKNKGTFPWPVKHGVITAKYGEHPHPVLKHVKVRNNGIDITTNQREKARTVFRGEVTRVVAIPGGNMAVIIRHGNYLTVYSNLSAVYVKVGQVVNTLQEIGAIFTDSKSANETILKFQLWNENKKENPENWLTARK
jgi:murein DD-endopeptidase MepM/ murein hydrolase activator NlpD